MRLIHAHLAKFIPIKDGDLIRLLEHQHCNAVEDVGNRFGPTLYGRARRAGAAQLHFAVLLHGLRRPGLQDRIGVIADQQGWIADEDAISRWQDVAFGIGDLWPARPRRLTPFRRAS